MKKVKAAPAANTPLRNVSQERGSPLKMPLYRVWYAFRTDPASKHAAATRKVNLQMRSKHLAEENFFRNSNYNKFVDIFSVFYVLQISLDICGANGKDIQNKYS